MSRYCIVVAEGSVARFFTMEPAEVPELESGPHLIEQKSLHNPEHQAHAEEVWADRMGRNRSVGMRGHRYDDHRVQRTAEMERRFARDITRELDQFARGNGTRHVVVCAEKRMLGYLRHDLDRAVPENAELREVPKDLAKLTPRQLHDHLARDGHVPPRARARH